MAVASPSVSGLVAMMTSCTSPWATRSRRDLMCRSSGPTRSWGRGPRGGRGTSPGTPGPLHGDDVLGVGHHAHLAPSRFSLAQMGQGPSPLGEVLADGTQGDGPFGLQDGLGKGLHLPLRQGEDEESQPLGGLMPDARQAGKLLHHFFLRRGKVFHGSTLPFLKLARPGRAGQGTGLAQAASPPRPDRH